MGISVNQLGVILSLKEHINDKNVLSLGVQFPPSKKEIITFQKKFPELLSNSELDILSKDSFKDFQMAVDPKYRPEKFRAKSSAYTLTFNHGYLVLTKTGWSERFQLTSVGSVMNATCSKS